VPPPLTHKRIERFLGICSPRNVDNVVRYRLPPTFRRTCDEDEEDEDEEDEEDEDDEVDLRDLRVVEFTRFTMTPFFVYS
jgi:hypothetical protein